MQQFPAFHTCAYAHEYFLKQRLTTKQLKKKTSQFVLSKARAPAEITSQPNTAKKTTISVVLSMTRVGLTETEQFNCNMSVVLHTPGHVVANTRA